ncbi:rare lipoprotein A [Dyella jiangningensis]|uniref:septal ring lytic transglycosylase RlpA family protein n=1 Tax=Dyella sp. AtDHG13 TaxID=1938897 RepID=UPI000882AAD6|nr:septal ring lytic transglycosylase RlpA family protein [Dyella sp. AtDHG13]PXV52047.1 rare lipoprotein A [Dyella sp. AtDHG13]SDJ81561.1 rare lipoprotein A [Dyella jiangningensis]
MRWRLALPLLLMALLAGCSSGGKPRPSASGPGASAPASRGGSKWSNTNGGSSSRGGINDDLSRPQSSRYRDDADSVPDGPPPEIIAKLPEPVPKVEPRALYGNKSPYTVLGQTYNVLASPNGYVERGIASFYGNKFHGYKTSSLEDYDMYQFTAAHKTLPIPSYARVTNLENGKSVIVRINDRGPFHENRVIDLSYAAAVRIGVWPKGTGLVEVRAIDPAQPLAAQTLPPPPPPPKPASPGPGIYLQVGAFSDVTNAERVAQQLRAANFAPVQVVNAQINGRTIQRVRVGPLAGVDQADDVTSRIENMGLPRPQVAVD